jgi:hypothetical protein
MTPIKIRYTWKRKSDGKIDQAIYSIQEIEQSNGTPRSRHAGWELIARDISTGVISKDGSEIYNNDRVRRRIWLPDVSSKDYMDYNCDIKWNGWFYGLCVGGKQLWGLDPIVGREVEIIGSIHIKP